MQFGGKDILNWSLNYLGLANHPEVRQADTDATRLSTDSLPNGSRMMSGQTKYHEQLENGGCFMAEKNQRIY
jgi:glycine C-acetyltransferase